MRCSVQQEQVLFPVGVTIRDTARDRYIVEGLLGRGGFGAVYLVRDRRTRQNLFALKEAIDPNKRDRDLLIFEGEVLKRLNHRALPRVYSVFEREDLKRVYMLMDYIKGWDLEVLRNDQPEKRFPLPLVLTVLDPIVDALSYLHSQTPPIVHRDIKPANIIVPPGGHNAVLVDFGLAKEYVVDGTTTIFRHGSPGYAALEQYRGGTSPRTDIYGLGATIYTLLTGRIPTDAIMRAITDGGFDPLESANVITPNVPWSVAKVLDRAMSRRSDNRVETVEEFWQELHHATEQEKPAPDLMPLDLSQLVPQQDFERIKPALSQNQRYVPLFQKRGALLLLLLVMLIALVSGAGFLAAIMKHQNTSSAMRRVATPLATVRPQSTVTSTSSASSLYPGIAISYAGTISDIVAQTKTDMSLASIQQSQGNISGSFQGLGLAGPFKGTINTTGQIRFTVTVYAGNTTLAFEGVIKLGGSMAGSYEVLNQNGQRTGETGLWSVVPSP